MKLKLLLSIASTVGYLNGCGIEINEAPPAASSDQAGDDERVQPDERDSRQELPRPTCDAEDRLVHYSVQRNSVLEQREYEIGDRLDGRLYLSAYTMGWNNDPHCERTPTDSYSAYRDDVRNIWIEISQIAPYNPAFIKTYFVPDSAVSFQEDSESMAMTVDLDFITLSNAFVPGQDYLIRLKVENESGIVTSARTWNNDVEAFQYIGFTMFSEDAVDEESGAEED